MVCIKHMFIVYGQEGDHAINRQHSRKTRHLKKKNKKKKRLFEAVYIVSVKAILSLCYSCLFASSLLHSRSTYFNWSCVEYSSIALGILFQVTCDTWTLDDKLWSQVVRFHYNITVSTVPPKGISFPLFIKRF